MCKLIMDLHIQHRIQVLVEKMGLHRTKEEEEWNYTRNGNSKTLSVTE